MKEKFIDKRFQQNSLDLIGLANDIIDEYLNQGYDLTLRQLYYQMVARDHIPNSQKSYQRFGNIISNARLAGLVDWSAIIDRTRVARSNSHWDKPSDIIESAYHSFNIDLWEGQDYRPRVWIEKEALIGVIQRICSQYDVPYLACRGYMSQSAMWRDAKKAINEYYRGLHPVIVHLGDHDPSGIDMTRDITDRMDIFGASFEVIRIALNYDQVEEQSPPPNPAKLSDTRAQSYIDEYGSSSWELDALEPSYINTILENELLSLIDDSIWQERIDLKEQHKNTLKAISENYDVCINALQSEGII